MPITKEETKSVYENRFDRFRELRFTPRESRRLAEGEAHPTEAQLLLERGCDRELIVKILS
jgi:hypothetical protein